ncbi:MAG: hypothetical protein V4463_25260 [Pseudomonadota bacterium]
MKAVLSCVLFLFAVGLTACATVDTTADTAPADAKSSHENEPMTGSRIPARRSPN